LLGITKSIKAGDLGRVNKIFKDLKKEVNDFLEEYDQDGNKEIDVNELKENRIKLAQHLSNKESKL
jgi:hypothetical protein